MMELGYDLKSMLAYGVAGAVLLLGLKACEEIGEQRQQFEANEAKMQTPANMRDAADKAFRSKGFTPTKYVSMEKQQGVTRMGYSVTRYGVTYDASITCHSKGCSEPHLTPVRSEPMEQAAAELWKQNGYEIVSFTTYRQGFGVEGTQEALLRQNGQQYTGTATCELPQKCTIKSIKLVR